MSGVCGVLCGGVGTADPTPLITWLVDTDSPAGGGMMWEGNTRKRDRGEENDVRGK